MITSQREDREGEVRGGRLALLTKYEVPRLRGIFHLLCKALKSYAMPWMQKGNGNTDLHRILAFQTRDSVQTKVNPLPNI